MPLGPREVRTTSATASQKEARLVRHMLIGKDESLVGVLGNLLLTFGGDDVGLADVLSLLRFKGGVLVVHLHF